MATQAFGPTMPTCANQNAHEVTRDVTAWALSGIGPILSASWLLAWARLGPLGMESQGTAFPY